MDRDPIKTAIRRMRRPSGVCIRCGYTNPFALTRIRRSLLEGDHVLGQNHDPDLIVFICLNCHAEVTEARRQRNIFMKFEPDRRPLIALMQEAEALLFEDLIKSHFRRAELLVGPCGLVLCCAVVITLRLMHVVVEEQAQSLDSALEKLPCC